MMKTLPFLSKYSYPNLFLKIVISGILIFGINFNQHLSAQCVTPGLAISLDSAVSCYNGSNGQVTVRAFAPGNTFVISEVDRNSPDFMEITNVSGRSIDATGHYVATSDNYTNINTVNSLLWKLSGTWADSAVQYREDATGNNYWGNNLFWNSPSPGWVLLFDSNDNVIDAIFWGWTASQISNFGPTINSKTVSLGTNWKGNGVGACTLSHQRTATSDNDTLSDWTCATKNAGTHNTKIPPPPTLGNIKFLWNTGDTTTTVGNLKEGKYWVTVTAVGGGCPVSDTIVLTHPDSMYATFFAQNIVCFGDSTGVAVITVKGGSGGYKYLWSNGLTTSLIPKVPAGQYNITVTDKNGCIYLDSVTLSEGTQIAGTATITNETVANDGAIDLTPSGGNAPYTFMWSNNEITEDISGLTAGVYNIVITDSTNCVNSDNGTDFTVGSTVGIGEIESLALKIYPNPSNGEITLQMNGQTDEMIDVQLVNSVGAVVYQTHVKDNEEHQLHLQHLNSGMYVMILSNSKTSVRHQIVLK